MTEIQWRTLVIEITDGTESALTEFEKNLLLVPFKPITEEKKALFAKLIPSLFSEIYRRGAKGMTFGPEERLEDSIIYGRIEETYSGGSKTFINLTRSFLTMWREFEDIMMHGDSETVIHRAVYLVWQTHKETFFPGATAHSSVPAMLFEKKQRAMLEARVQAGIDIDIDDFFLNNPALDRSGNPLAGAGHSCLLMLIVGLFICAIGLYSGFKFTLALYTVSSNCCCGKVAGWSFIF